MELNLIHLVLIMIVVLAVTFGIAIFKYKDKYKALKMVAHVACGIAILWGLISVIGFISAFIQLNF